jgi:hypothetical protein
MLKVPDSASASAAKRKTRSLKVPARPTLLPANVRVVLPDDVLELVHRVGLTSPAEFEPQWAADEINDALYEAGHAALIDASREYSRNAAWCASIEKQANELASSILDESPSGGWAPWDAIRVLQLNNANDRAEAARHVPAEFSQLVALGPAGVPLDQRIVEMVAEIAPRLRVLSLLAARASAHWTAEVKRGGRAPHQARSHLMTRLTVICERMFGIPPTISVRVQEQGFRSHRPEGKSLDWFEALFAIVVKRLPQEPGTEPLRAIATSALTKSDALANWINEAGRQGKSKPD